MKVCPQCNKNNMNSYSKCIYCSADIPNIVLDKITPFIKSKATANPGAAKSMGSSMPGYIKILKLLEWLNQLFTDLSG